MHSLTFKSLVREMQMCNFSDNSINNTNNNKNSNTSLIWMVLCISFGLRYVALNLKLIINLRFILSLNNDLMMIMVMMNFD